MSGRVGKVERVVLVALEAPDCVSPTFRSPSLSTAQLAARCYPDGEVTESRLVVVRRAVNRLVDDGVVTTQFEGRRAFMGVRRLPAFARRHALDAPLSLASGAVFFCPTSCKWRSQETILHICKKLIVHSG